MASEKIYKQVSPGIKFREIDNSALPDVGDVVGPVIIGRAERGPAMRPVKVNSYSEFLEYFGNPSVGNDFVDVWRDNIVLGPSYGAMAAQATLQNKPALTYVRLLGTQHSEADASTSHGLAGWSVGAPSTARTGGAFGLLVFPSGSSFTQQGEGGVGFVVTGTLAAVWYVTSGSVTLSGLRYSAESAASVTGTAGLLLSNSDKEFRVLIKDENNVTVEDARFNFTPTSDRFIRKVFNTNPTKTNSSVYSTVKKYWLGETFEDFINNSDDMASIRNASTLMGAIVALKNGGSGDSFHSRKLPSQNARTGWFISQDMGSYSNFEFDNTQKLFKFHALDSGEWAQSHIKISIRNIKVSTNELDPYGTFDVVVRQINDSDANVVILEQFNNCTLNPNSNNYVAKQIGDKYVSFSTTENRNLEYGEFDNKSKYIRIEMDDTLTLGAATPELLPFGVYGPIKIKNFAFSSGSLLAGSTKYGTFTNVKTAYTGAFALPAGSTTDSLSSTYLPTAQAIAFLATGSAIATCSVVIPYPRLRVSTLTGTLGDPKNAYFGVFTDDSSDKFQNAVKDLTRIMPLGVDSFTPDSTEGTDYSWKFSLDDIRWIVLPSAANSTTDVTWISGTRQLGTSITSQGTYNSILTGGYDSFTTLLAGGFDGLDITEIEPFNNSRMGSTTVKTSYAQNTIMRAIEMLQYPEDSDFSDAAVPGVTLPALTRRLAEVCELRGDALAVIDLENDFTPRAESTQDITSRRPNVTNVISSLRSRQLNTNYACAYFPWVQGKEIVNNSLLFVPPSVVALGAFAYNDRVGASHMAPAGFNRGLLSSGQGGIPVTNVTLKLLQKDRDLLYAANINPIAVLDKEVVIWGQKTLQLKNSALDRINVRRGLLELKKKFARIAYQLEFEPNVAETWQQFKGQAEPILADMKARLGLEDYKLVMDNTTNTPDNRDRNIIYAKVFLKPVKTAEFFIIDFNISSSGASFANI